MVNTSLVKQASIAITCLIVGISIGAGLQAHSAPETLRTINAQVVRTQKFQLVDGKGRVCAGMEQIAGNTLIHMNDINGRQRLGLGLSASGDAYMDLEDQNEKTRAQLNVWKDGTPHITLLDKDQKERFNAAVNKDGEVGVRLLGKTPELTLCTENGEQWVWLALGQKGYAVQLPNALHVAALQHPGGFLFLADDKGNHAELVPTDGEPAPDAKP